MNENRPWDKNLKEVVDFIFEATKDRFSGWTWVKNTPCKYISLRIDMRDGAFVLFDCDGKRIDIKDLKYQFSVDGFSEEVKND